MTKRLPNSRFETNTLLWRSLKKKIQHISDLVFFTFQEKLTDSETFPQLLAVSKELEIEVVAVATSTSDPEIRTQFDKAIKNFIWDHSKELSSIGGSGGGDRGSISGEGNKSADAKSGGELETSRDTIRPLIVLYIYIFFPFIDNNNKVSGQPAHETHEGEIKRRRYTVYLSDLEKTMLYSLNHEVAQHAVITGDTLNALQDYVDVLVRYFPGRKSTMR